MKNLSAKLLRSSGLALVSLSLLGAASGCCKKSEDKPEKEEKASAEKPSGKRFIKKGEHVVAQWITNSYYEGTVVKVKGMKVEVKWDDKSKNSKVDKKYVFLRPTSADAQSFSKGQYVICKKGTLKRWYGAQVLKSTSGGKRYRVWYTSTGMKKTLDADDCLKAPPGMKSHLKKQKANTVMLKAAKAAGRPEAPAGFKPRPGQEVVAVWVGTSWYSASVKSVSGTDVMVKWKDKSKDSKKDISKVVPVPTAKLPAAKVGDYIIAKPSHGSRWSYGKVTKIKGSDVEAMLEHSRKRTLARTEYLRLGAN